MIAPTFLSVFSGIGGFDLGLERSGWQCVGQIEIEPFCNRVLTRHWPAVPRWGDITQINPDDLPIPDLLCGGFPCTDVSVAGRRKGLAGEQSGLFFEFARLAAALRPTWLLVENVPGLFSSNKGRDFATILATLGDIGYGVAWRVLDSRYFGVAQRRRRVFLIGHLGGPCPAPILFERESLRGHPAPQRKAQPHPSSGTQGSLGSGSSKRSASTNGAEAIATGSNGTAGARAIPALAGTLGSSKGRGWCDDFERSGAFIPTAYSLTASQSELGSGQEQTFVVTPLDLRQSSRGEKMTNNRQPRASGGPPGIGIGNVGDPSFTVSERGQAIAYRKNLTGDILTTERPTLRSQATGANQPFLMDASAIRRLTPTECEILQAFYPGWTCLCGAQPYSTWSCACPDSPRYAALGNAVTTTAAQWIGTRLLAVHHALGYDL